MTGGAGGRRWYVATCALLVLVALQLANPALSGAGMYSWVDEEGNRHVVDSREKVPPRYRSKVIVVQPDDAKPNATPTREKRAAPVERVEPQRESATRKEWVQPWRGVAIGDAFRAALESVIPRRRLWPAALAALAAVLLVRTAQTLRTLHAAQGLAGFRKEYDAFVTARDRGDSARLALEARVPSVVRWVRNADIGSTTVGSSREVGMGRVVDEGRIDVLGACLVRPDTTRAHLVALLRRTEGIYRHRARRPWTVRGFLESALLLPRFLVRPGHRGAGAIPLLLVLFWSFVAAWLVTW